MREQAKHLAEQGDRTPSQQLQLNVDIEQRMRRDLPLLDRISLALDSGSQPHELWALSTLAKICPTEYRVVQLLPAVIRLLSGNSQNMEFAAVCCCTDLALHCGERVSAQLAPALIERLKIFPGEEYVTCLSHCIPFLGDGFINDVIFPVCRQFLTMDRTFQYAAAEILLVIPFRAVGMTETILVDSILPGEVVSAEYIPRLVMKAAEYFGRDWMATLMPKRLVMQANSFQNMREGVVRVLLTYVDKIEETGAYLFLMAAFGWAGTNEGVALSLIERADDISKRRGGEFSGKVREIGIRLAQNGSKHAPKLFGIYAKNPVTFLSTDSSVRYLCKGVATAAVRRAFIENFHLLYGRAAKASMKETLFSFLLPAFSASDADTKEALIANNAMYVVIGASKVHTVLGPFIKIAESMTSWRLLEKAISICSSFPDDVYVSEWMNIATFVNNAVIKSPFALARRTVGCYQKMMCKANEDQMSFFLVDKFAASRKHQFRSLFVKFAAGLCFCMTVDTFKAIWWPKLIACSKDPVNSVRCALIKYMEIFRMCFAKQRCKQEEKDAVAIFMGMGRDTDPLVQTVWRQCLDGMNRQIPVPVLPQKARDTNSVMEKPMSMADPGSKKLFQSTGVFRTGTPSSVNQDTRARPVRLHTSQRKVGLTIPRTAGKKRGVDPLSGKTRLRYT